MRPLVWLSRLVGRGVVGGGAVCVLVASLVVQGGQGKTAGAVLTMTFESSGDVLWVGDSKVGGEM